jgi:cytidine diphosphoramidate kinase
MVIWLVGLSGSGKTTVAKELTQQLRKSGKTVVLVDGDEMRSIFEFDQMPANYTLEGRRRNAERILAVCKWLEGQGVDVVCSILCIFPDILRANREVFPDYVEVFLDVALDVVKKRDVKGLYAAREHGETQNVVGIDIEFPKPTNSDLTFNTGDHNVKVEDVVSGILSFLEIEVLMHDG